MERLFYEDQCGTRKMVIGRLDVKETNNRVPLIKKQLAVQQRKEKFEEARKKLRENEEKEKQLLFKKVTWDEVSGEEKADLMQGVEESGDKGEEEGEVRLGKRGQSWSTAGGKRRRFSAEDQQFLG